MIKPFIKKLLHRLVEVGGGNAIAKELHSLHEELLFLLNECSELRQIIRFLQAESPFYQSWMKQTRESFDSQWDNIPEGKGLVTDIEFNGSMLKLLENYTGLSKSWFKEKNILDAGCGNGRWSYALSSIGAYVTAIDQSEHGLNYAKNLCQSFPDFKAIRANLLDALPFPASSFDMVWSYGVLHHTGNTYGAFMNIAPLVKSGGALFLMLYGEPDNLLGFKEINHYTEHRRAVSGMNSSEIIQYCNNHFPKDLVHGYFDAISPAINDLYRFDEIRNWLIIAGYERIERTFNSRNLYIMAWKK